jgi:hypothetical protein
MSINTEPLFKSEQQSNLVKTVTEIINSRFVDPTNPPSGRELMESLAKSGSGWEKYYKPGVSDYSNPEVMYREYWHGYITQALLHGQIKSKRGKNRYDTTKERSNAAKRLAKHLGRTPTCADLKTAFQNLTQLNDELCRDIDKELKKSCSLTSFEGR